MGFMVVHGLQAANTWGKEEDKWTRKSWAPGDAATLSQIDFILIPQSFKFKSGVLDREGQTENSDHWPVWAVTEGKEARWGGEGGGP